ncbi:uncharacterized protein LOC132746601 [Ruditapes philippinarum]|uniref:uncharacterized protein LOC132746601 n=1 Tax=Ruditapes philippinarum TaxID=129788 RepID=UPI00295A9695|nr:uncharacterized protein LOC132746601 [Ruditapes philippinarum]
MFDGELVNATSNGHQNMDPCMLYLILIGSCDSGYHCEVSNNVPRCRQNKEDDDGLFHIIIAIISTLCVLIIIGAIINIMCLRKRKQKQKKHGKQRNYFADSMRKRNYGGGNYHRTAKAIKEDTNSEGNFNSKVLAWNPMQSGFTDLFGRDIAYNQPLQIPRVHNERSNSFGIHNNGFDSGGARANRAPNSNGIFKSSHGINGGRSNRARNDNGILKDGFENDGFRVSQC